MAKRKRTDIAEKVDSVISSLEDGGNPFDGTDAEAAQFYRALASVAYDKAVEYTKRGTAPERDSDDDGMRFYKLRTVAARTASAITTIARSMEGDADVMNNDDLTHETRRAIREAAYGNLHMLDALAAQLDTTLDELGKGA